MRSVLGGLVFGGDAISMGCNRSGVMRSSVDRFGCDRSRWIDLRWGAIGLGWCNLRWISLGGSIFGGDAILVVVRDIWWRRCWGAISCGWIDNFLSLSLSLRVWDPKMVWSENRNVNQFSGQSHKTHGQLKCFSGKFYFPCATKHAVRCKIISWNGFTPKQTQPKFHTKNFAIRPICWRNYYSSWLLMWSSLINEMMSFIQMYVWAS